MKRIAFALGLMALPGCSDGMIGAGERQAERYSVAVLGSLDSVDVARDAIAGHNGTNCVLGHRAPELFKDEGQATFCSRARCFATLRKSQLVR